MHPAVGIVGTGVYLCGLVFLGAGGGFVAEGYLLNRLLTSQLSFDAGWLPWALTCLLVAVAVNYAGVRVGIRVLVATAMISAAALLVVAVAVVARGGAAGNTLSVFEPRQTSWGGVFHGVLFAVSLFIGFETVAALGEEVKLPRRSIPAAMVISIGACAGFYLLVTYAGAIGFGKVGARTAWFASGDPFGELGQRYVGQAFGWIINVALVLDLFSVCVAFTLAASRVLMVLARDRLLPRPFSSTSRRFHSPTGGLAGVAAGGLTVTTWSAFAHFGATARTPGVLEAVLILSASGTYLITFVYLLLALGGLRALAVKKARGGWWWQLPAVLSAMAVPALSFDGSLDPFPTYPNDIAVYFAVGSLGLALAWYVLVRSRRPDVMGTAAAHAESADLLGTTPASAPGSSRRESTPSLR